MKSNRLIYLILMLSVSLPVINHCKEYQERSEPNKDSLSINFESFNERYKDNQGLQIIDSRTLEEYKNGHIPGALILPVQDIESSKNTSKVLSTLKKDEEVYIYCSAGGPRSQRAAVILRVMGFKKAYFVTGGIAKWIAQGNPIEKD